MPNEETIPNVVPKGNYLEICCEFKNLTIMLLRDTETSIKRHPKRVERQHEFIIVKTQYVQSKIKTKTLPTYSKNLI